MARPTHDPDVTPIHVMVQTELLTSLAALEPRQPKNFEDLGGQQGKAHVHWCLGRYLGANVTNSMLNGALNG